MDLLLLFVSSIFIHNILLSRFLGCCPFMGVSTKLETARGMGLAVVFVIMLSSLMTWLVYHYVLVPLHLEYLYTLSFILVIAALVQFVELALKKLNPGLYKSLGIFLPLITTNCAVLGVAVINMNENYTLAQSLVNALGSSLGFLLAITTVKGNLSTPVGRRWPRLWPIADGLGLAGALLGLAVALLQLLGLFMD